MANLSPYETIRLKITAFLFNRRADALRGEMYRALCLGVFTNNDETLNKDEIVKRVASALGKNVKITDSLKTIVYEELRQLEKDGFLLINDSGYEVDRNADANAILELQEENPKKALESTLYEPIKTLSLTINPSVKPALVKKLVGFFIEAASLIANDQTNSLAKGKYGQDKNGEKNSVDELNIQIENLWDDYEIENLDYELFITKALLHPEGELATFLYKLVQVNIISQLLSWDPDLEFIKKSVLSNKVLYLDSSALFLIMQENHPLHHFFISMIRASQHDLGVKFKIHQSTLKEYKSAVDAADVENRYSYKTLKEMANICRREGTSPFDILESSILADYVIGNSEHIDSGSWQNYIAKITGRRLHETLAYTPIEVDKTPIHTPDYSKFKEINSLMLKASERQVHRRKRGYPKKDTDHDAKLFYLISGTRRKSIENQGEISVGYDKYLLTLDGSLVYFSNLYRIPIADTYFIYPNQWYEITFPFLRLNPDELPQIVSGLTSMIYSRAFPKLTSLIPLELCKYIFENGGLGLSLGSIRAVAESMAEERLVDSLRTNNDDLKKQEEAKLRVERIVAEERMKKDKELQDAQKKAQELLETHKNLAGEVKVLSDEKEKIFDEVSKKQIESGKIDELKAQMLKMKSEYESLLADTKNNFLDEIKKSREYSDNEINALKEEKRKERLQNRKLISTILMTFGLIGGLIWLLSANVSHWWFIGFVVLMFIGTLAYYSTAKIIVLILTCLVGFMVVLLSTQTRIDSFLAIGGLAWSIVTTIVDWYLKERKS